MGTMDAGVLQLSGDLATCQVEDSPQTVNEPVQSENLEKADNLEKTDDLEKADNLEKTANLEKADNLEKTDNLDIQASQATQEDRALFHSDPPTSPPTATKETTIDRKKEDEKLSIYKALAIKLKKELVKSRDELHKIREDSAKECSALKQKVQTLEASLETLQQTSATTTITLESRVRSLKEQLENSELDLQTLQNDFENYKVRASKIMQENNPTYSASNKTFEEDRYRQLKELNDDHLKRISTLESQLSVSLDRNCELEKEGKLFQKEMEILKEELKSMRVLDDRCETLSRENDNLKVALKQFRTKLKELMAGGNSLSHNCDEFQDPRDTGVSASVGLNKESCESSVTQTTASSSNLRTDQVDNSLPEDNDQLDENGSRVSPSVSVRDDSQTNSSSSYDESTSGYVHIKPTTFEIISRSSVLEDAQIQIDSLTKAYLDSENTNSLLSDQIRALKEEIRRLQRGTERLDLAENLEYLKNIVFKFISLDSGQTEQKQRLVPVLSTVLKLSPDETAKLNSLATINKPSMASSFFKL